MFKTIEIDVGCAEIQRSGKIDFDDLRGFKKSKNKSRDSQRLADRFSDNFCDTFEGLYF